MTHPNRRRGGRRKRMPGRGAGSAMGFVLGSAGMYFTRTPKDAPRHAAMIVRRHLPDSSWRVFLFGSRATGTAHARSHIDIGIEGPQAVPRPVLAAIEDELDEAPTLYTIDIIDFARVSEAFQRVARERIPL